MNRDRPSSCLVDASWFREALALAQEETGVAREALVSFCGEPLTVTHPHLPAIAVMSLAVVVQWDG